MLCVWHVHGLNALTALQAIKGMLWPANLQTVLALCACEHHAGGVCIRSAESGYALMQAGWSHVLRWCVAVLAHGYNYSVDWWGLGVLTYVLLTGRQPFSSPKTDDPMVVMRRIVDENYIIKYPPFLSQHAKVRRLMWAVLWCAGMAE